MYNKSRSSFSECGKQYKLTKTFRILLASRERETFISHCNLHVCTFKEHLYNYDDCLKVFSGHSPCQQLHRPWRDPHCLFIQRLPNDALTIEGNLPRRWESYTGYQINHPKCWWYFDFLLYIVFGSRYREMGGSCEHMNTTDIKNTSSWRCIRPYRDSRTYLFTRWRNALIFW